MPSVEPPPSSRACPLVNGADVSTPCPQITAYRPSTAICTTLLAIGAHIIGPNESLAFSTWPIKKNAP